MAIVPGVVEPEAVGDSEAARRLVQETNTISKAAGKLDDGRRSPKETPIISFSIRVLAITPSQSQVLPPHGNNAQRET